MKQYFAFLIFIALSVLACPLSAQNSDSLRRVERDSVRNALRDSLRTHLNDSIMGVIDSINATFEYQTGIIKLFGDKAELHVPEGYKFLDSAQSLYVYRELWGNGEDGEEPQGLLLPDRYGPLSPGVWAVEVSYEQTGYIKDDEAKETDFEKLLEKMQNNLREEQAVRQKRGLEPVELKGWAEQPRYDAEHHSLYWAKELQYGELENRVLNYNIRILGRRGVMVLTIVGDMKQLPSISKNAERIRSAFRFRSGHRYTDFDPSVDEIAVFGLAGLIAGKFLLKVGLWASVLKFGKWGLAALVAGLAFFRRFFRKEKNDTDNENDTSKA